jgi:hypothetical protein
VPPLVLDHIIGDGIRLTTTDRTLRDSADQPTRDWVLTTNGEWLRLRPSPSSLRVTVIDAEALPLAARQDNPIVLTHSGVDYPPNVGEYVDDRKILMVDEILRIEKTRSS